MLSITDSITKMLKSSSFQYELKKIQDWATNELYEEVLKTVYDGQLNDYSASGMYERTFSLLTSIMPTDLIVTPTTIEFKVIFDPNTLNHTTLYGSEKYGLEPGDPIGGLIVPFLNEGWDYSSQHPNMSKGLTTREGAEFLEKAITRIQADVNKMVQGVISTEIKKIGGRY